MIPQFQARARRHMLECWFASQIPPHRGDVPGCDLEQTIGVCRNGLWTVSLDLATIDQADRTGLEVLSDRNRFQRHVASARAYGEDLLREIMASGHRAATPDPSAQTGFLIRFFEGYTRLQAYYQISSDIFAKSLQERFQSAVNGHGDLPDPADIVGVLTEERSETLSTFRAERTWLEMVLDIQERGLGQADIQSKLRVFADRFGPLLAEGSTLGSDPAVMLRERLDSDLQTARQTIADRLGAIMARTAQRKARVQEMHGRLAGHGDLIEEAGTLADLTVHRMEVRELFSLAGHLAYPVFEQAFERFDAADYGGASELYRYLTRGQVLALVGGLPVSKDEVLEQYSCSVLEAVSGRLRWQIGASARRYADDLLEDAAADESVRGIVGNSGPTQTGRALVVANDLDYQTQVELVTTELRQGDILVIGMTYPSIFAACSKAAAIVTDFGGVTAHAVLVAREFGIPCIVGTRRATSAFRTGEHLIIDTAHATVSKQTTATAQ